MMVLEYCKNGNLREHLNQNNSYCDKIKHLSKIATGLLDIHNNEKVHKDFHSGNILFYSESFVYISDLGMCQPANNNDKKKEGIYGVLPYMAPEVLCGRSYTKAADIYSFGIVMNEFISEEIPHNDIPHDFTLTVKICKGLRPKISEDTPKLLADLIIKCWDAKAENRPTAKELHQILKKWDYEVKYNENSEIHFQIKEYKKIRVNKLNDKLSKNRLETIQTHPQAIYTSRLLNFKNLPEPVNSTDLSSFQVNSGNSDNSNFFNFITK
jgi:serine/threonine protein kinase